MAAEQARQDAAMVHVGLGLEHVRNAQAVLGAPALGSRSRSARAWRELNAASAQFSTVEQILDGILPVHEPEAARVAVLPAVRQGTASVASPRQLVAERRVIVNLGYPEGLAVLGAIETALRVGMLKRSARERLERVHDLLAPRVVRARRARRAAA